MATPHHLARSRRRSGDGIRSARCSIAPGSSDPRLPTPFTTCTPQPAPCCVAEPQELAHSLCGRGERANPGQHGSTARTQRGPPHSSMLPECTFLAARLPALLHGAPCGAPIRHTPHGCRCLMPLRTRTRRSLLHAQRTHHATRSSPKAHCCLLRPEEFPAGALAVHAR